MFHPTTPGSYPTVLLFGGSGGRVREGAAEALVSEGFAAPALAYSGIDPLPRELVEILLEYFEEAIAWLKLQSTVDADRIAVMGNSKDGELALLLGATYPEDIEVAVGYVPSAVVWQEIPSDYRQAYISPKSSWASGGEPLPFLKFARHHRSEDDLDDGDSPQQAWPIEPTFYEPALDDEAAVDAASIAVEKIKGPVLVISGTDDPVWPSTRLSEMVIERLKATIIASPMSTCATREQDT